MTKVKYILTLIVISLITVTGCDLSTGTDGPSDSEVEEVMELVLTSNRPLCPMISETLDLNIVNRFDPVETEPRGTHYDVRVEVRFRCSSSHDITNFTDNYRFRKSGVGSHPSGWHAQPLRVF